LTVNWPRSPIDRGSGGQDEVGRPLAAAHRHRAPADLPGSGGPSPLAPTRSSRGQGRGAPSHPTSRCQSSALRCWWGPNPPGGAKTNAVSGPMMHMASGRSRILKPRGDRDVGVGQVATPAAMPPRRFG
jgi:hypothetical protein